MAHCVAPGWQNSAMRWDVLLSDLLALLREGRSAAELAAHEAALGALLRDMQATGHHRDAPVRSTLAAAGDRWTTLILEVLWGGELRHSELRRIIDLISAEQEISQRVLTLKLRALERDGMVARRVTPGAPPRADYCLTERGRDLHQHIQLLVRWAGHHTEAILASRRAYDARRGVADDQGHAE